MTKTNYFFIICSILFIIPACNPSGQKPNCSNYHTGKFLLRSKIDDSKWIITRENDLQTEINEKTGDSILARIKWTDDCDYELLQLRHTGSRDSIDHRFKKIPLQTHIIATGNDYCVFEARKEGIDMVYSDTLWTYSK